MIIVRVPGKRNPHVRFSEVDPDVDSDMSFAILNERNAGLALNEEKCKVRVTFRERSGTSAFLRKTNNAAATDARVDGRAGVGGPAHAHVHVLRDVRAR
ncbi:hypothetical protein HPB50_014597 [Hyalomma asiaticum]|uniref:Uncharacterized protein n=1 Tax=Hyalomma asiaticum TaxID=266040 RepID=A0ACB7T4Y1_HYAAI|nr:hypothetical protein HPB50_014597 [Hyalomma asiaticum]